MRYVEYCLKLNPIMIATRSDNHLLSSFASFPDAQTLIPLDFKRAGQILDDDLYKRLVTRMSKGVTVVVLMDCCHSGTALDLPYEINATQSKMSYNQGFNTGLLDNATSVIGCCLCLFYLMEMLGE